MQECSEILQDLNFKNTGLKWRDDAPINHITSGDAIAEFLRTPQHIDEKMMKILLMKDFPAEFAVPQTPAYGWWRAHLGEKLEWQPTRNDASQLQRDLECPESVAAAGEAGRQAILMLQDPTQLAKFVSRGPSPDAPSRPVPAPAAPAAPIQVTLKTDLNLNDFAGKLGHFLKYTRQLVAAFQAGKESVTQLRRSTLKEEQAALELFANVKVDPKLSAVATHLQLFDRLFSQSSLPFRSHVAEVSDAHYLSETAFASETAQIKRDALEYEKAEKSNPTNTEALQQLLQLVTAVQTLHALTLAILRHTHFPHYRINLAQQRSMAQQGRHGHLDIDVVGAVRAGAAGAAGEASGAAGEASGATAVGATAIGGAAGAAAGAGVIDQARLARLKSDARNAVALADADAARPKNKDSTLTDRSQPFLADMNVVIAELRKEAQERGYENYMPMIGLPEEGPIVTELTSVSSNIDGSDEDAIREADLRVARLYADAL